MARTNTSGKASPSMIGDLTGRSLGGFYFRAKLGSGGMGEVYLAQHLSNQRPVAVKRIAPHFQGDQEYRKRLLREARYATKLSYDHIAGVYDVVESGPECFVVMEYVQGRTLRERITQRFAAMPPQLFSVAAFLSIATQCCSGLEDAH